MNTILSEVLAVITNEFEYSADGRAWCEKAEELADKLIEGGMSAHDADIGRFAWEALHKMALHAFMAGWRMRGNPDELLNLPLAD